LDYRLNERRCPGNFRIYKKMGDNDYGFKIIEINFQEKGLNQAGVILD
jgi:hypothetical protein